MYGGSCPLLHPPPESPGLQSQGGGWGHCANPVLGGDGIGLFVEHMLNHFGTHVGNLGHDGASA